MSVHDSRDGEDLYRVLREEVIPLYYQRDRDGLPRGWIKRMKRTIRTLGWRFNADRMVMDYTLKVLCSGGWRHLQRYEPEALRPLAIWSRAAKLELRANCRDRFDSGSEGTGYLSPGKNSGEKENRPRYRRTLLAFYQVPQALKGVPEEPLFAALKRLRHPKIHTQNQNQKPKTRTRAKSREPKS